jgi:Flp pilus assembly pilin Flp
MKRRRRGHAGSGALEMVVLVGILGLGMVAAFVAAGTRLHQDYRAGKSTLTSPYP